MRIEPKAHSQTRTPGLKADLVRQSATADVVQHPSQGSTTAPAIVENASEARFLLRFVVPAREVDALTVALRSEQAHAQRCQSTYFDTADGRLAARGVFLSLCKRGRGWVQLAVATTPDCTRLLVHEVDLGVRRHGAAPGLLVQLHDGTQAGAALRAAIGNAVPDEDDDSTLLASFAIDATRLTRDMALNGCVVELAQVTGMITTDDASAPFQAFEVRLVSGPLAPLFALARDWSIRHGLRLSTVSDGERGARLAAGHPDGFPTLASTPDAPLPDGPAFLQAMLDSCLAQILANASVIGDGTQDRHVIDQLRHGLERLRTTLAELAPMAPGIDAAWEPVFKRTFHELAAHRGAAAIRAPLIQEMRAAGLGYALDCSHPREIRLPSAIVQDTEFQLTLMAILAYRHALSPPFKPGHGSLRQMRKRFAGKLAERHAQVGHDAGHLRSTSKRGRASRHLNQLVRLALFAGPLYDAREVDRFLLRCRVAQDAFTTDSEHRSGLDALADDGESGMDVKLARRWLAARLEDDRTQCEALLRRAGKAAAFWAA